MKTIKQLFLATILFCSTSIFANDATTVYSCGFEANEDLSAWDLTNAAGYLAVDLGYQGYRDYFFVGSAAAYEGQKSLYVSNDNGMANNITATNRSTNNTGSSADLNITLAPGNYTMDFAYKMKSPQRLDIIISDDRFNFDSYTVFLRNTASADTWTNGHIEFSVTETTNWVEFWYQYNTASGGEVTEGLAIDNVVIKKLSDFVIDENGTLTGYLGVGGNITIPEGVKRIDENAFDNTANPNSALITSISLPSSLETIDPFAFDWCPLTSFSIAAENTNFMVENGILYNADKTTIVRYPMLKTGTAFSIPNTVKIIGPSAFYGCENLISIVIPNSVETIQEFAFMFCYGLISVDIPNSVKTIGEGAFYDCSDLQTITIPSSIATMDGIVFSNCIGLKDMYVNWQDPTNTSEIIHTANPRIPMAVYANATLHVPAGTVSLYQTATYWKNFVTITDGTTTGMIAPLASKPVIYTQGGNIVVENAEAPVSVYDISGHCIARRAAARHGSTTEPIAVPQAGVYMVRVGSEVQKVMVK